MKQEIIDKLTNIKPKVENNQSQVNVLFDSIKDDRSKLDVVLVFLDTDVAMKHLSPVFFDIKPEMLQKEIGSKWFDSIVGDDWTNSLVINDDDYAIAVDNIVDHFNKL